MLQAMNDPQNDTTDSAIQSETTVPEESSKPPLHKRKWFVPVVTLMVGLMLGTALASPSIASSGSDSKVAALEQQVSGLKTQVDTLTTERDGLKQELVPYKAAEKVAAEKAEAEKVAAEKAVAEKAAADKAAADQAAAEKAAADKAAADQAAADQAAAEQAAAAAASAAAAKQSQPSSGGTVYITRTGEKYHLNGCQYLSQSQIAISLADAKSRGYGACSRCY